MVADPYLALDLPHSATSVEIKRSYHLLAKKYHPDRQRTAAEKDEATTRFARISEAYALLSDPERKAKYDHIYKYGGYDDDQEEKKMDDRDYMPTQQTAYPAQPNVSDSIPRKRPSTGVGYRYADPLAFLWTNGKVQSKTAVAGIQIPSRLQTTGGNGLRFAFSSGQQINSPTGTKKFMSQTTQFAQGKKITRTETTTIHPDGRREVVIESNDFFERRFVPPPQEYKEVAREKATTDPWYANAWTGLKDRINMCYNPCVSVS